MRAYFDTSLMVTLITREPRWAELDRWMLGAKPRPFLSDFGWGEFVSALGRKVRLGELSNSEADEIIEGIAGFLAGWNRLRVSTADLSDATAMVAMFSLGLRFPDAIHIAVAKRTRCTLLSADDRQLAAARHLGVDAVDPYRPKSEFEE